MNKRGSKQLALSLRTRLERQESFQITPEQLVTETGSSEQEARSALEALKNKGVLAKRTQSECHCGHVLDSGELEAEVCTACNKAFKDYDTPAPLNKEIYAYVGEQTRDVRWVLVLHGMNTRGSWQEEFSWLLSRVYGYSVPVAIYKYGMIRPGVLFPYRMRALAKKLINKVVILSREAETDGFGGVPDVVAHSFGTWLIGHALQADGTLKIGRVILLGSILRPDFDWETLIKRGQVEAVMCHRATGDMPVGVTQFIIPDSGPSGRLGFNSGEVIETVSKGLSHSGFFDQDNMPRFYDDRWQPFLTSQESVLKAQQGKAKNWRPNNWSLRARLVRYVILILLFGLVGILILIFGIGVKSLVEIIA